MRQYGLQVPYGYLVSNLSEEFACFFGEHEPFLSIFFQGHSAENNFNWIPDDHQDLNITNKTPRFWGAIHIQGEKTTKSSG